VSEIDLDAAVDAKVSDLLKGGPEAQAAIKVLLRDIESVEMADTPGLMSRMNAMLRAGEEGQEGLGAFLKKREPRWRKQV
jgi:methylglutaconyl-CoA hydratase